MNNKIDYSQLLEIFPELAAPDTIYEKEVLAHFGLLFSKYANLEAGIQNCYIIWQLGLTLSKGEIKNQSEWSDRYDTFESEAFAATFGSLLKLVSNVDELKPHAKTLISLKKKRDYFAHHFFREENKQMLSNEAMLHMLSRMNALREEVNNVSQVVDEIHDAMLVKLYPNRDINAEVETDIARLKDGFSNTPATIFGWENL